MDLVTINDMVKTVEKSWGQVSGEIFHKSEIKQPISILDYSENVIYETSGTFYECI